MEVHLIGERTIYRVPRDKWLMQCFPELEIDCVWCGAGLRFNEFHDKEQQERVAPPQAHTGHCFECWTQNKTIQLGIKEELRRREGLKKISQVRVDAELRARGVKPQPDLIEDAFTAVKNEVIVRFKSD